MAKIDGREERATCPKEEIPPDRPCDAFAVTGAGSDVANGLFFPSGKTWHGAPMFENDQWCVLVREPHINSKTGQTLHGWILGKAGSPLYAVQSDALKPPCAGWLSFRGEQPAPQLQASRTCGDAAAAAAKAFKQEGNDLFASMQYLEAEHKWTRALGLQLSDEDLLVALYANRAEARLRLRRWQAAFDDAMAVLLRKPYHDKALLRAAVAAREMGELQVALYYTEKCAEAHAGHREAKALLEQLEDKLEAEAEDIRQQQNVCLRAFHGYSDSRTTPQKPLSMLPYHNTGFTAEEVESIDTYFRSRREDEAARELLAVEVQRRQVEVRRAFKASVEESVMMGKLERIEDVLSMPQEQVAKPRQKSWGGRAEEPRKEVPESLELPKAELDEIDALFSQFSDDPAKQFEI